MNGTELYHESQVRALKQELRGAEVLTNLYKEKEDKIRARLQVAEARLNHAKGVK